MIHIYTGNGKGKTTAAFGLAMRANGQGHKVVVYQFLKPRDIISGEEISAENIKGFKLIKFNQRHPMFGGKKDQMKKNIKRDFEIAKRAIFSGKYDMVVLDEIINVVEQAFVTKRHFLKLLKALPGKIELVLTGRGDVSSFERYVDYITVMRDKKHPFKKIKAMRRGIEY